MTGSIAREFCNNAKVIWADCAYPDPEIIPDCPCCYCYNDDGSPPSGGVYDPYIETTCDLAAQTTILSLIKKNRGVVTCGCVDEHGLHVRCQESCISCNLDELFCVRNLSFQLFIQKVNDPFFDAVENKVQHMNGNNNITLEWGSSGWLQQEPNKCWVRINGEGCESCAVQKCINGKNSPLVKCGNIPVANGNYDGCDETQIGNLGLFDAIFMASNENLVNEDYCPILDPMNPWSVLLC